MTIRVINTETRRFDTFLSHRQVKYAIVSHTWGSEELNQQDWKELYPPQAESWARMLPYNAERVRNIEAAQGFRKIEEAIKQALRDGYRYLWVDTVCIDKTSSAELSEAINSML